MTRLARTVFALLVLATGGAFFAAQKLKTAPPVLLAFRLSERAISPNGDGRFERQKTSFMLKRDELIDVAVVDQRGDSVREIASGLTVAAYRRIEPLTWNGRTESGSVAPDGRYRIRVTLRREGRSVTVPKSFRVDTTPPRINVLGIGPGAGNGPELLPRADRQPASIRINTAARDGHLRIFRTAPLPLKAVAEVPIDDGSKFASWDGRDAAGNALPAGTYVVVAESRDSAGVLGSSVALDADGLPKIIYGQRLPGHGGITVRRIAAEPPLTASSTGSPVRVDVVTNAARFKWTLSRLNGKPARRGSSAASTVRLKPPAKSSTVFLFTARTGSASSSVPVAVDDRRSHPVLVVLPLITWQGRNPVDDDGDGQPNLLTSGGPAQLARVLGTPFPARFNVQEKPILRWLDSNGHRYDLTTDYALSSGRSPALKGHRGVLLVGDTVWLPESASRRLAAFVRSGGTLVQAGTDSLRRGVSLSAAGELTNPLPPATTDIFGSSLAPLEKGSFNVTAGKDQLGLFEGTSGLFSNYELIEQTTATGKAKTLSSAVTEDGAVVIVAFRVGRGIVIRYGLPQLPSRLATDPDIQGLIERSWQLLSR